MLAASRAPGPIFWRNQAGGTPAALGGFVKQNESAGSVPLPASGTRLAAPRLEAEAYREGQLVANKYRLVRELGQGAMGTVWEAINTSIGLPVALKLCSVRKDGDSVKARLRREAQVAGMLTPPAVVRVFDYGESFAGDPFLVMEMLEGETLGVMLQREHHLAPELAVQMLLPIASGVHAANTRGIVHRDLKPDNIIITRDDAGRERPKIVDFGVAMIRWLDADDSFGAGAVVGTPEYMPPEQALAGEDVDHRADVWALCATLYEILSGAPPFGSSHYTDALVAVVVGRAVPSLVESSGIDVGLWQIIAKGLRRDPHDRWSNTGELGEALAAWLLERGIEEDASGTSLRAHWAPEAIRSSEPPIVEALDTFAIPLVNHVTREVAQ
jgi:serine/threonine-protein kinase